MRINRTRLLGGYLIAVSVLQLCLYGAKTLWPQRLYWLFYFDPRMGLALIDQMVTRHDGSTPGIFLWLSAVWLLVLGALLILGRSPLGIYIFSEVVFSAPNLLLLTFTIFTRLSPIRAFAPLEFFAPVGTMIICSLVPLIFAVYVIGRGRTAGVSKGS